MLIYKCNSRRLKFLNEAKRSVLSMRDVIALFLELFPNNLLKIVRENFDAGPKVFFEYLLGHSVSISRT